MKVWFALLLIVFGLHAVDCTKTVLLGESVYVSPEQVRVTENGIFLLFGKREIKTSALHADSKGLFFIDMWEANCDKGYWECSNCHHCNPALKFWCEVCYK